MIELLGGAMAVESEVGKGSTFKVLLPMGEAQDQETAVHTPAPAETKPQKVILSIDDDPESAESADRQSERDRFHLRGSTEWG